MKRKVLIISLITLIILTGCVNNNTDNNNLDNNEEKISQEKINEEKIFNVLNNKEKIVTEKGNEVYLKDYILLEDYENENLKAIPYEYTLVDFDADQKEEMVVNISYDFGNMLVLHYNGQKVYGYEFVYRGMSTINKDGSFMGSNGAASSYYCRLSFEGNKKIIQEEAIEDTDEDIYQINGKKVSAKEIDKFTKEWHLKEKVNWIKLKDTPKEE